MNTIELGIKITADGSGQVKADITDINSKLAAMGKAGADAGAKNKKAADEMRNGYKYAKDSVESLKKTLLAYISISAAWNGAKQITATADAYTNLTSKLKVVTGTTQEFNRALQDTSQIANQYQQDINSVGAAYNRLAPIVANLGKSQKDVADAISSVSAALKLSGASTSEASETLRQFGQALSGPTVQMEEMNTIIDSASVLWQGLQRQFPDLIRQYGSLKEAVGKGALSNKDLLEATIRLRKEFDAQAGTMQTTVAGALRTLSNEWEKYIGNADQASESSKSLANGILLIAKNMETLMYLPAKMVEGWGLIFEAINKATTGLQGFITTWKSFSFGDAVAGLFSPSPGGPAPSREEYMSRYGVNPAIQRTPDQNAPRFDGINRSITTMGDAADKAGAKVKKMKGDLDEGIDALARKWRLNSDQIAMAMRVYQEAQRIGVDPNFAVGLSYFESGLKNRGANAAGARGPMQVIPGTFNRLKRDYPDIEGPNSDALSNIRAGLHYIKEMAREFGSYKLAAAGYLAGEGSVRKARGMPHKVDRYTGVTTEQYADRVMKNAGTVASLLGGSDLSGWEKTIEDEQKRAYDLFADRLDRQTKLADMNRAQELEKQKIALQQLGNEYSQWEQKNQLDIKFAVDQKSYEEQIQLINDAQSKAEDYIREMNRTAGGEDTARVQALNEEIKLIDQKIAKVKETTKDEQEIAKLQDEKKLKQVEREKEVIAAQSGNLDLQKALAENTVKYDAMREEAGRRIVELQTQQADIAQRLGGLTSEAAKEIIDSQTEQLRSQVQINAAQREAAINNNQDLTTIDKQREAIKGRLVDTIAVVEAEARAAQEKLAIDQGMLAYEEEILRVRLAGTKSIQDRLAIEAQLAENTLKQAAARKAAADIEVAAAGKIAKAQADAANDDRNLVNQNVQEQQLRLNAFWDQYMGRLTDYASLWQEITGETQNGFSKMAIAMGEYAKQSEQIGQYFKQNPMAFGDMTGAVEGLQQGQAALAAMAKTMLALRTQYKEGTQGYKDMTSAAERMMEIQRALQLVEGVLAVIHQATGADPYTAIPRMLGVAAMIGSMGVNVGLSGGSGIVSNRQIREATQSGGYSGAGGGVFGDSGTQSDSIARSLEIVSQNSSADLAYSAGMLRALTDIKFALMGTTNAIIRGVGPNASPGGLGTQLSGFASGMNNASKWINGAFMGPIGFFATDAINKVLAPLQKILFNVTKKITDWGIKDIPQTLGDILKGGFQALNYTEVTTTTKMLGITVSKKSKDYFSALNSEVGSQMTRAISGIADSVLEAGKAFGLSAKDFNDRLKNFVVDFGKFSTKGLKGQELQDAISQMFSSMSDDMARAFMPGLDAFMQAGEGYFQTLVRVSSGIEAATGMLEQAGLKAINYQDIILKQGDIAAEIIRQSIVAFEGIGSAIGAYVDQAVGSAEELMAVYQDLLIVSDTAKLAGFNLKDLSNALIVTSGGVAKFLENLTTYQTEILGGSDYARQVLTLTREFGKLGIAVPKSNEAFVRLVDSIDTSTEAGQKLYAQILSLAGAFSKAQQEAAKLEELRAKYLPTDSLKGYRDQIKQVDDDFRQIIEGSLARLPGGGNYLKRTRKLDVLGNRVEDRQDKLAIINADIRELEAKGKLTQAERARLATLRQQRKDLTAEIKAIDKQIADINALIAKNPKSKALLEERAKLIEEQGDAVIKTLADIWDSMAQAINNAKETLKSIQDSIFELAGGAGGESIKYGMANARRISAESAYNAYSGNDINRLNALADAYYKAIMDEYNAKMELINAPKVALEKERELRQKAHDEQIQALEKELSKVTELRDAIKSIQKYALDLKLGSQSTASPRDVLLESQKQFEDLLKRAQGGDVTALQDITGASTSYLEAAQKYYGSNTQYANIYDGVLKAMEGLGAMNPGDADSIQARIDALNEEHGKYLTGIEKKIADLKIDDATKALQKETSEKLKKLADDFGPRITEAENKAREDMNKLILEVGKTNIWNEKQLAALNEMLKGWGMAPVDVSAPEPTLPAPTDSWVQDIYDKWIKDQTGYKPPLPAFASGGLAGAGWAIVGEEGPELVKFAGAAQVYDSDKTKQMLRDMVSMPINLEKMPRVISDTKGKPINLEKMPRVVNDLQRSDNKVWKTQYTDDVVAELRALQREVKALVTTQSGANPQLITELQTLNRRMDSIERTQRIKP